MPVFERDTIINAPVSTVFGYHAAPRAFDRLSPAWDDVEIIEPLQRLADGEKAIFKVPVGPVKIRWVARHENVHDGMNGTDGGIAGFDDVMESGPASSWRHEHRFEPLPDGRSRLRDRITWTAAPGGGLVVGPMLERMFRFRHRRTIDDLDLGNALAALPGGRRRLVVGVTGSTGLIGRELCSLLSVLGHEVRPFVRVGGIGDRVATGHIGWVPATGAIDATAAAGLDAVVHLAGENIADGRLTDERKARLRHQRVEQTTLLWASLAALPQPPSVVVGAAAVGFYGDRGDVVLDEDSPAGTGALSSFCAAWEGAILAAPTTTATATKKEPWRAVAVRVGIVQSPKGGALGKVLPLFKAGLGGALGDGRGYLPWIAVDDIADVFLRCLVDERVRGVVNGTAPSPARQAEHARALGAALSRPAILPVPAFALRAALGRDLGDHILESMRVEPRRLLALGHRFRHTTLDDAFGHLLGRA